MNDGELDDLVRRASETKPAVDPALLESVTRSIGVAPAAVRVLPAKPVLAAGGIALCVALAGIGALILGPAGVRNMSGLQAGAIFPLLAALAWLAAWLAAAESIPGSARPVTPWALGLAGCVALALVFGLVFPDHHAERFVPQGVKCLTAGLAQAIPVALAIWMLLRRGYAVNPAASAFARGTLAGLAGVIMLELHCPNFELPHVMVWHIAVLPICGLAAMALGARRRGRA